MPIRAILKREDDSVIEDKIVGLCYPYQLKGVVHSVTKIETRRLEDNYQETVPPQIMNMRVLTRDGVIALLRREGRGSANFEGNTSSHPEGTRYVVHEESLDVRVLDKQD